MNIRDEDGFSAAEGCMFAAVALFALLLVALLIIVALRFRKPPERTTPAPAATRLVPVPPLAAAWPLSDSQKVASHA